MRLLLAAAAIVVIAVLWVLYSTRPARRFDALVPATSSPAMTATVHAADVAVREPIAHAEVATTVLAPSARATADAEVVYLPHPAKPDIWVNVHGRLVTESGAPISAIAEQASLDHVWIDDEGSERLGAARRPVSVVNEGGGWFNFDVLADGVAGCRRVLMLSVRDNGPSSRAFIEIPEHLAFDLSIGAVMPSDPTRICAGIVLGPGEHVLDGCEIRCETVGEAADSDNGRFGAQAPVVSHDGGHFEVSRYTRARRFTLIVSHPSFEPVRVEDVALGTEHAIIRMRTPK